MLGEAFIGGEGEEGAGMAWGGDGWVLRALEVRGEGAGRRIGAWHRAAGAARKMGRRLRVEDDPDRWAPPVSGV
jgi:hypothetical protein